MPQTTEKQGICFGGTDAYPCCMEALNRTHTTAEKYDGSWFVLQTRPGQEERAVKTLTGRDVECYLPVVRSIDEEDSDHCSALYPNYLFARATWTLLQQASVGGGILGVVSFGGVPATVGETVIESLRAREGQDGCIASSSTSECEIRVRLTSNV